MSAINPISLTVASANLLLAIGANLGRKDMAGIVLAGLWFETHLSDLPLAPLAPGPHASPQEQADYQVAVKAWGRQALSPIPVTAPEFRSLSELIKAAVEREAIPPSPAGARLLIAFGFGPDKA